MLAHTVNKASIPLYTLRVNLYCYTYILYLLFIKFVIAFRTRLAARSRRAASHLFFRTHRLYLHSRDLQCVQVKNISLHDCRTYPPLLTAKSNNSITLLLLRAETHSRATAIIKHNYEQWQLSPLTPLTSSRRTLRTRKIISLAAHNLFTSTKRIHIYLRITLEPANPHLFLFPSRIVYHDEKKESRRSYI